MDKNKKIKLYSSSWCGTCRLLEQTLKQNNIDYVSIDVDASPEVIDNLNITGIPVVRLLDNGKELARWTEEQGDFMNWYNKEVLNANNGASESNRETN